MKTGYSSISQPVDNPALRILSLGAGVQSTVLALLAAHGEIKPMPDAAIFADTRWEPAAVYEHLDWLETRLPFPVHRVSAGNIREDAVRSKNTNGGRFASMPFFLSDGGMGRRQCTKEYKIEPIIREIRKLVGVAKGKRVPADIIVEQWIGISTDELQRLKNSRLKWIVHRWPLIEIGWKRHDCQRWFAQNFPGRPLAKSACIGCPFHNSAMWRVMRDEDPDSWSDAILFDAQIRDGGRGMRASQFVHADRIPLSKVDLSTPEDHGQLNFLSECDGMCGV